MGEAFQGRGSGVYKGEGWGKLPGEEEACPFRKGRVQLPFVGPWQPPWSPWCLGALVPSCQHQGPLSVSPLQPPVGSLLPGPCQRET